MIKHLHATARYPLRNPKSNLAAYDWKFERLTGGWSEELQLLLESESATMEESRIDTIVFGICEHLTVRAMLMYGRGDPLAEVIDCMQSDMAHLQVLEARWNRNLRIESLIHLQNFGYLTFRLLLLPEQSQLKQQLSLVNLAKERSYLAEVMIKAFLPDWQMAKKYSRKGDVKFYQLSWSDPVLRILCLPAEELASAFAAHMQRWERIMKPYDPTYGDETSLSIFNHFAFEVALAVCAYDIDDSSFRSHRYYPRDVVDYYRANLRNTRDAWRPVGVGAGIPIEAPPPIQKADLSKSKRKGLARWIELVSDGEIDATDDVLEQVGKLRKVKDLTELTSQLAENNIGVHTDMKDDDTLTSQLDNLLETRGLPEFTAPDTPPEGIVRCEMLFEQYAQWLLPLGYCLISLYGDDDAWHAVIIKADYLQEWRNLSQTLNITEYQTHQNK